MWGTISLKHKLVLAILGTSTAGTLVAVGIILAYETVRLRHQLERELSAQAEIVAVRGAAALEQRDTQEAAAAMSVLRAHPETLRARLRTADGTILAEYGRGRFEPGPQASSIVSTSQPEKGGLVVVRRLARDDHTLGTVELQADGKAQTARFLGYASILLVVLLGGLLVSLMLSLWLQRVVSNPILALTKLARRISRTREYSLRAVIHHRDEVGALAGSVNEMLDQIQKRDEALREREREVLEISHREQERIGQDLHDCLAQDLLGAGLKLQLVRQDLCAQAHPAAGVVDKALSLIERALPRVRNIARGAYPVLINEAGLVPALEDLAHRISLDENVACQLECPQALELPDPISATHLYRIVQEAVHNAIKHGRATRMLIRLLRQEDALRLTIFDNGTGIQAPGKSDGMGLQIMRYRATALGGTLRVGRLSRGGTIVSCVFRPFQNMKGEPSEHQGSCAFKPTCAHHASG